MQDMPTAMYLETTVLCILASSTTHSFTTGPLQLYHLYLLNYVHWHYKNRQEQTHYKEQNSANYPVFGFENLALLSIMPASSGNLCKHAIKFVAMSHRAGI